MLKRLGRVLVTLLAILALYQLIIRILAKGFRRWIQVPAPAFLGYFLSSRFRYGLQPPAEVIHRSGIEPGMSVLDLGCGSGALALPLADFVGEQGRVIAVDLQRHMLRQFTTRMAPTDFDRILPVQASAYALPLANASLDACVMSSALQEIPNRQRALREVWRVLKPGGVLAVTEFLIDPDYPFMSTTMRLGEEAGFEVVAAEGHFWNYTVRFRKMPDAYRAMLRVSRELDDSGVTARELYEASRQELEVRTARFL